MLSPRASFHRFISNNKNNSNRPLLPDVDRGYTAAPRICAADRRPCGCLCHLTHTHRTRLRLIRRLCDQPIYVCCRLPPMSDTHFKRHIPCYQLFSLSAQLISFCPFCGNCVACPPLAAVTARYLQLAEAADPQFLNLLGHHRSFLPHFRRSIISYLLYMIYYCTKYQKSTCMIRRESFVTRQPSPLSYMTTYDPMIDQYVITPHISYLLCSEEVSIV